MVAMSDVSGSLKWETHRIAPNLEAMAGKVLMAVTMKASTLAPKIAAWMKENRPWTDRTGFAKLMLDCAVSRPSAEIVRLTLYNNKPYYGKYLEGRWGGRYSILRPAIDEWAPKLITEMNGLLEEIERQAGVS